MAKTKDTKIGLAQLLRAAVEQTVDKRLSRLSGGRALGAELVEIRRTFARLDRRVEALGRMMGARPRRGGARRTGSPGRPPLHEGCRVEGCRSSHYALGLCSRHYQQVRRGKMREPGASARKRRGKGKR